ncbi:MAG TPA: phosphoribosylanthranilate isomerase [Vicinamibacteria bacterium]|nr:phosphoribosylanthranilate isomerase [Vicinamibacteria bacterium]
MSRVLVKICGITSPGDARLAVEAGADALGFVFWPGSPRRVDPETARRIGAGLPPFVWRVGVFVDADQETLAATADAAGLDLLQLHGDEPPEAFAGLNRRALKALRVGGGFSPEMARPYEGRAAGLLLDTQEGGAPGGTGRSFDWSRARGLGERVGFLMLAGGLTPENVADAIAVVRPHAVDVSSGVESAPGRKDPRRVRAFVEAVRRAEG